MKPYMSYWSHGYQNKKPSEFVINLHKLSSFYLKKNFGEVHLVTDKNGAEILKDIKWDSVSIDLENLDQKYSDIWSLGKILAYKIACDRNHSFIHVDYDVVLWEGVEDRIKKADVFAQSEEINAFEFYNTKDIYKYFSNDNFFSKIPKDLNPINMGIFGGNDLNFIKKYSEDAIDFITNHKYKNFWNTFKFCDHFWHRACVAEQFYLSAKAYSSNKKIEYIFQNGWPSEEEAREKKYTHLMNDKNKKENQELVSALIKKFNL
jgi:hypothetical protein